MVDDSLKIPEAIKKEQVANLLLTWELERIWTGSLIKKTTNILNLLIELLLCEWKIGTGELF